MNITNWTKLGIGIKRWVLVGILGMIVFSLGVFNLGFNISGDISDEIPISISFMMVGIVLIAIGINNSVASILKVINQYKNCGNMNREKVNKLMYRDKILSKGPKIVVIGGGTGLSVLLRGLKEYTSNITAIVTVADDGGGSGILREDLGMLPPGDIRSCLLALANTEPAMEKILQYRFKEGNLKGQSFGNLFIAAMNEIHGNFEIAIKEMSNVLALTGRVIPMTLQDVKLYAKLKNGDIVQGESNIPERSKEIGSKVESVFLKPKKVHSPEDAIKAIKDAKCIVLGPGSLFTSVIPNLLVQDIVKEIDNSGAIKIYISNVMTQPGETDDYKVIDHINTIQKHTKRNIINYVIANKENITNDILEKYSKDGAKPVIITEEEKDELMLKNIKVISDNLIDIKKDYIRHDAKKLSEIITRLTNERIEAEKIRS